MRVRKRFSKMNNNSIVKNRPTDQQTSDPA